jgi:hypothetical protein
MKIDKAARVRWAHDVAADRQAWRRVVYGAIACASLMLAQGGVVAGPDASCTYFRAALEASQLDRYRDQGLKGDAGDTKLSVILWDEYRRARKPDPRKIEARPA